MFDSDHMVHPSVLLSTAASGALLLSIPWRRGHAEEFLCRKYLVKSVGRLWHFELPPAGDVSSSGGDGGGHLFC